jgi:hypothetical protein
MFLHNTGFLGNQTDCYMPVGPATPILPVSTCGARRIPCARPLFAISTPITVVEAGPKRPAKPPASARERLERGDKVEDGLDRALLLLPLSSRLPRSRERDAFDLCVDRHSPG